MQIINEILTTGPQQNVSGTSDNVGFFPYGWPAYSIIKPGWTCVQTGAIVTVVDGVNLVIQTVGTPFASGSTYTFTGPGGMTLSGGMLYSPPPPPPGPTLQGSLSFNGTSQYLGMSPGFALGTDAFTIEGWFYNTTDFTSRPLVATDQTFGLSLYTTDDQYITLDRYGGNGSIAYSWAPGTFQTNKWMYFILNRNPSGLETMYVGVQSSPGAAVTCNRASFAAGNFDPNDYTAGTCIDSYDWSGVCNRIGTYYGGYFPGYITNFRATIGDAKYDTNNSTVSAPSIELTSDAYTQYLMLGGAVTTDSSGTQTVTNNNGVTQSATKPF